MKRKTCLAFSFLVFSHAEAGIFLKAKDPIIIQDAVWLYSNSTAITSIAPDVEANKFSNGLIPIDHLPMASTDGTIGVLYNRDTSCSSTTAQQPIPLPFYAVDPKSARVPKIAFIKSRDCSIYEKVLNAQLEGAIGAILYDDIHESLKNEKGLPSENNIKIPAYYVDRSVGQELYHQLEKMAGVPTATIPTNDGYNLTTRISVRIQLYPADNIKPTAWELTLLVMIVILATSIVFTVVMHIHIWRKNKRLQHVVERHGPTTHSPMGKPVLSVARLYEFPTRTIDTLPDEEERQKLQRMLSDQDQRQALIRTTALSRPPTTTIKQVLFGRKKTRPTSSIKWDTSTSNLCAICLEAFKIGDQVRELPCHHEYHCICIDPWLTSKSGVCPLCKFDCSTSTLQTEKPTTLDPAPHGFLQRVFLKPWKGGKRTTVLPTLSSMDTTPPSLLEVVTRQQANKTASEVVAVQRAVYETATENHQTMPAMDDTTLDSPVHHSRSFLHSSRRLVPNSSSRLLSDDDHPRPSIATFEYTPTITTMASTYAAAQYEDPLPDRDISSISMYSMDLEHIAALSEEELE